jgi:hypothetical protein
VISDLDVAVLRILSNLSKELTMQETNDRELSRRELLRMGLATSTAGVFDGQH